MDSQTGADEFREFERADPPLRIDVVETGAHLVRIVLNGEVDLLTVGRLRAALAAACRPGAGLLLDLDGLTFLGSIGVRAIVDADRAARDAGASLSLVVSPGHRTVTRVLALTGLDQHLAMTSRNTDAGAGNGDHPESDQPA